MIFALIIAPIVLGLATYAFPRTSDVAARVFGTATAAATFVLALVARNAPDESVRWLSRPFTANFHFGTSGPGYWIVLLLALSTACAIAVARVPRARDLTAQMLILLGAMDGVFLARDLLLFALFWDLMLIPVFLVLIAWAPLGPVRAKPPAPTAWRYLVYNLTGGLALLLAVAAFGVVQGTTDVIGVNPAKLAAISPTWAWWIFLGLAFAFAIKTPIWPFHTWMPATYVDLPAPMAAVVSAVQSKAGLYGFIVITSVMLPAPMHAAATVMLTLGGIGLLYGAFAALVQDDVKAIVAYSSLSHLGLIVLAIFSFNAVALDGAVVYIVAHGLFSAGLFLVLGEIELREDTRSLAKLGGLGTRNPRLAGGLTILILAALGLPGLAGFAGEILILTGVYQAGFAWLAAVALVPIVLAAAYMLRAFQNAMQGPEKPDLPEREDMSPLEIAALAPIVAAIVLLGISPGTITAGADHYFALATAANAQPVIVAPAGKWETCPASPGSPSVAQVYVESGQSLAAVCSSTASAPAAPSGTTATYSTGNGATFTTTTEKK